MVEREGWEVEVMLLDTLGHNMDADHFHAAVVEEAEVSK